MATSTGKLFNCYLDAYDCDQGQKQEILLYQMYFRQVPMNIGYVKISLSLDKNKNYILDK